ncbi:MAG: major capsid protein [Pontimonas sp.]
MKLNILFESATNMELVGVDSTVEPTCQLFSTFVYLDTEERKRFSQQSHEYLITTLQHTGAETISPGSSARTHNIRLSLNHPVRVLSWVIKNSTHGRFTTQAPGETSDKFAVLKEARLQLNGHDRFDSRKGAYFNKVQPFEHVSPAPNPAAGVYSYHFGLRSNEQVQPSGSCNFSRIDNATLVVTTKAASVATTDAANLIVNEDVTYANAEGNLTSLQIYAESYNVLRILSGMGGLAYSS